MRQLHTKAVVLFWADFPDDDIEADAHADRISEELEGLVETLPYVLDGSVSIHYLDTEPEPS